MVNYSPKIPEFPKVTPFLPCYGKFDLTTYIQGASDYEIMANLVQLYNTMATGYNKVEKLSTDTVTAYNQLQDFVNEIFKDPDLNNTLQTILNNMFNDGTMQKYLEPLLGYVTPEMFGAAGDGVTDDTISMKKAISYCESNNIPLVGYSNSNYLVSETLTLKGISANFNNATITIESAIDDGLIINSEDYNEFSKYRKEIKNLKLNAIHCKNAIRVKAVKYLIDNLSITAGNTGLYLESGYENTIQHCNITGIANTIGIDVHGNDHLLYDIVTINCKVGVKLRGVNRVNNFHSWIYDDSIRKDSMTICIESGYNFLSQCYCDGTQYGVYWDSYGYIFSEEMFFLNNVTYFKDYGIDAYCMFDSGYPDTHFAKNPTFNNSQINILKEYKLSNFGYLFDYASKYPLNGVDQNIYYKLHDYELKSASFNIIDAKFVEYKEKYFVYIELKSNTTITQANVRIFTNTFLKNNMQFTGNVQEERFGKSITNCSFYSSNGTVYLQAPDLQENNVCSMMAYIPKEFADNKFMPLIN